nr:MAG TPA: hypothetical protein [Caudoviricetes sp.]
MLSQSVREVVCPGGFFRYFFSRQRYTNRNERNAA